MVDEDLQDVEDPLALAHSGMLHSNEYGNHVRRYCYDCQQTSLQGCWFANIK